MAAPLIGRPVLPVLDDGIDGNTHLTVTRRNRQELGLGLVALLRLPHAPGPPGHHRGIAGQPSVSANHVVHLGAENEVVVDSGAGLGADGERMRRAGDCDIHIGDRCVIPEKAPAVGRHHHGDRDIGVGLLQVD